jgi:hypothetical protein
LNYFVIHFRHELLFVVLLELDDTSDTKDDMDDINKLVNKVFGDKEKLSASEFRQSCESDEIVKLIAQGLQFLVLVGFTIGPQVTKYGTE